jgi:hypothetical protein
MVSLQSTDNHKDAQHPKNPGLDQQRLQKFHDEEMIDIVIAPEGKRPPEGGQ